MAEKKPETKEASLEWREELGGGGVRPLEEKGRERKPWKREAGAVDREGRRHR